MITVRNIIIVLLCNLYGLLSAQNVKQIIEWERPNLDTVAISKKVTNFDKNGNLINFYCEGENYRRFECKGKYKYDAQNRIVQKEMWSCHDSYYKTNYTYEDKKTIIRYESYLGVKFTYQYLNDKGLTVEEKTYDREGTGKDTKLVLEEWVMKKYDSLDNIIEETFLEAEFDSHGVKNKRIYEYDDNNNMTKITTHAILGMNGYQDDIKRIKDTTEFEYNKEGRLVYKHFSDGFYQHNWSYQTNEYKDGKLYIKETGSMNSIEMDIHQNGKRIRTKIYEFYNENLIQVIDYQYIY